MAPVRRRNRLRI